MSSSSENHNAFFENILQKSNTHDLPQEKSNDSLVHHDRMDSKSDENNSQSSCDTTDQLLRVLMAKIESIEDFLIRLLVKVDNCVDTRRNGRTSNKNPEIDISELKVLGLPAESQTDIEKLEDNLKNEDFKKKLVIEIEFYFELLKSNSCFYMQLYYVQHFCLSICC